MLAFFPGSAFAVFLGGQVFLLAAWDWQTPAALFVVATALAYMTRGWWPKRATKTKPGCGSNCGCAVAPKAGALKPPAV